MMISQSFYLCMAMFMLLVICYAEINTSSQSTQHRPMIQHLEPVSNFKLSIDPLSEANVYHIEKAQSKMHTESRKSNSFTLASESSTDKSKPYGNKISLSFEAYNEVFNYELQADTSVLSDSARIEVVSETSSEYYSPRPTTYRADFVDEQGQNGVVVATILDGGDAVDAVIFRNGEIYHVQPATSHLTDTIDTSRVLSIQSRSTLQGGNSLAIYKSSDINDKDENGNVYQACGSAEPLTMLSEDAAEPASVPNPQIHLDSLNTHARHLLLKRWENCFPNTGLKRLHIAVAVDYGSFTAMGSDIGLVTSRITATFAQVNEVYRAQLGLIVTIGDITIMSSQGRENWNFAAKSQQGTRCPGANELLSSFSNWRRNKYPSNYAAVLLITNCFPAPGTVGLAWTGTTCGNYHSSGWANVMANQFLVVAHELAHILGGNHSFQDGQGKTGGILDYGNGSLLGSDSDNPNEVGFHTRYTKNEMCDHLTKAMAGTNRIFAADTRVPLSNCFTDFTGPICGDGVVDGDEECDVGPNGNACCTSDCKFTTGSTCSTPSICCQDCKSASSSKRCGKDRFSGYCSKGSCQVSACNGFSNASPCGFLGDNNCRETCNLADKCTTLSNNPTALPTGTYCTLGGDTEGVCYATKDEIPTCVAKVYQWSIINDTFGECSCQGVQTKKLGCVENNVNIVASSYCENATIPESATQSCTPTQTC